MELIQAYLDLCQLRRPRTVPLPPGWRFVSGHEPHHGAANPHGKIYFYVGSNWMPYDEYYSKYMNVPEPTPPPLRTDSNGYARGGRGNHRIVSWGGEIHVTGTEPSAADFIKEHDEWMQKFENEKKRWDRYMKFIIGICSTGIIVSALYRFLSN